MYIREYIDEMFVNRLNKHKKDDVKVKDQEFEQFCCIIKPIMETLSKKATLPGFTEEDIMSFFFMKVHQIMRRGQLKPPYPVAYVVKSLKTLLMEINEVRSFYLQGESMNEQKTREMIAKLEQHYQEKFNELTEITKKKMELHQSLMSQDLLDLALPFGTLEEQTIIKGDEENTYY